MGEAAPPPEAVSSPDPSGDEAIPAVARPPRRLGLIALVAALVVAVDQLTKWWVVANLSDGHTVHVVGSLRFNLAHNTGAAFSLGSDKGIGPWVVALAFIVIGVLVATTSSSRTFWGALAAGLVVGGAIGNLLDRALRDDRGFLRGAVVDFIDLQWWPIFNVADAGICVGAVLLVLVNLRQPES